jgi:hypothetical protein
MSICGKETKKHLPYLKVQNFAYTEKNTRSQHLHNSFAAAKMKASASAATTNVAGSAGFVEVDVAFDVDISVATSASVRLWRQ